MTRHPISRVKGAVFLIGLLLLVTVTAGAKSNTVEKLVRFFAAQSAPADGSTINGSFAKLTRDESAVWIRVNTTGLSPGAYTNWWVIFNNPAACTDPCSLDDLFNLTEPGQREATQASVLFKG